MNSNGNGLTRVATYARVSTQEQATEGTSLEFQQTQLATYCQLQGWTLVNSYLDPGASGKDGDRPGLERLLADSKIRLFDKVVVYKLDRLSRNLRLLLEIEQTLRASGASLISVKESVDTSTSTGKMVFQVLGLVAEWESESIIERTRNGRIQRYRDGCWAGGKSPHGYSYNRTTKKLEINETEARTIRRIYSEYCDGKSLYRIAEGLNRDRIPCRGRNSKGWRQTSVRLVLINPMYKGNQIVNRNDNIANINKIDLSQAIQISVPPIVTEQVWQIAQERLKNNKHAKPKVRGDFLLQGLIKCGVCGYAYRADRVNGKRHYICRGRLKYKHLDGSPRCKTPSFRADWLENQGWLRIEEIINDPDRLAVILRDTIENLKLREADLNARIKPIDERLADIASQKAKLADDWVIRHMDSTKFKELRDNLDKEEVRIKALRAEIDPAQLEELESTRTMLRFWQDQMNSMAWNTQREEGGMVRLVDRPHQVALQVVGLEDRKLSDTMGFPSSKRDLLDKLQVKLVVFNDRIDINGLFPIQPINSQLFTSTKGD